MLNDLISILQIVIVLIFLLIVAALFGFMYYKKKSRKLLTHDDDFRTIPCIDSKDYIPIEDIADNMIIDKGRKRFSAVIKCSGFDFYNANIDEKVRKQGAYQSFLLALSNDITYRQYGEDIDLDYTIDKYENAYKNLQKDLFFLKENYMQAKAMYDNQKAAGNIEASLEEYLITAGKTMRSYDWRLFHLESQIDYLKARTSPAYGMQRLIETYVVSYEKPVGFFAEELTEEELHKKAIVELDKICRQKIRQLSEAGVGATRVETIELIDMFRKHYKPYTGNLYPMKKVEESSYFDDVVTGSENNLSAQLDNELDEDFVLGGIV